MGKAARLLLILLAGGIAGRMSMAAAQTVEYPSAGANVSFDAVMELPFQAPHLTLGYGVDDATLQRGSLWLPAEATDGNHAPLAVLVHGGCWLNAFDIRHTYALATALSQAGFAVWSLEYRRTGDPGGGWPGTLDDIRAGLAYRHRLTDHPIDLERTAIVGHSAGGHLALLAASESPELRGAIGLAAITDILTYARGDNSCESVTANFMGVSADADPAAWRAANPVEQTLHARTVLLQGDVDTIVDPSQAMVPNVRTLILNGAGHFDWVHPGTRAFRLLLATLNELTAP